MSHKPFLKTTSSSQVYQRAQSVWVRKRNELEVAFRKCSCHLRKSALFFIQPPGNNYFCPSIGDWGLRNETLRTLFQLSRGHILLSGALELFRVVFSLLVPLALKNIINYVDEADELEDGMGGLPWNGLGYGLSLIGLGFLGSMCETHSFFQLNMAGLKTKSALIAAIFRKTLTIPQAKGGSNRQLIWQFIQVCEKKKTMRAL